MSKQKQKIITLLDIESFSGIGSKGTRKWLLFIAFTSVIGFGVLWLYAVGFPIPWPITAGIAAFFIIRAMQRLLYNEKQRLKVFKDSLHRKYELGNRLLKIANIEDDGCVQYTRGSLISYTIKIVNKEQEDVMEVADDVASYFNDILTKYPTDIRIHNISTESTLKSRYKTIKRFEDPNLRELYLRYIDHNSQYVKDKSKAIGIYITVYSYKYNKDNLKRTVDSVVRRDITDVFQSIEVITDRLELNEFTSRDLGTDIDYERMNAKKYYTGEFYGSKVIEKVGTVIEGISNSK